jgi:hypothetical protein
MSDFQIVMGTVMLPCVVSASTTIVVGADQIGEDLEEDGLEELLDGRSRVSICLEHSIYSAKSVICLWEKQSRLSVS